MKAVHTTHTIVEEMLQNEMITSKTFPIGVIGKDFYYEVIQKKMILIQSLKKRLKKRGYLSLKLHPKNFQTLKSKSEQSISSTK